MNNEPVAVVDHRQQNGVTWLKIEKGRSMMPSHNTLLYTHPANLTDEEILNIAHQIRLIDRQTADDGHLYFARAILKKAQEK